jgi:addiction module HigA family antidote
MTKRKPATVGEILVEEFMKPMGLTQAALAEAMGVQRKHVNELCNNRRNVTAATALILARVFGNSPDFWLNVQRRSDLWEAMNSPVSAPESNVQSRWGPRRDPQLHRPKRRKAALISSSVANSRRFAWANPSRTAGKSAGSIGSASISPPAKRRMVRAISS